MLALLDSRKKDVADQATKLLESIDQASQTAQTTSTVEVASESAQSSSQALSPQLQEPSQNKTPTIQPPLSTSVPREPLTSTSNEESASVEKVHSIRPSDMESMFSLEWMNRLTPEQKSNDEFMNPILALKKEVQDSRNTITKLENENQDLRKENQEVADYRRFVTKLSQYVIANLQLIIRAYVEGIKYIKKYKDPAIIPETLTSITIGGIQVSRKCYDEFVSLMKATSKFL